MGKIFVIFLEFCLPTREITPIGTYNIRIKSVMFKWSVDLSNFHIFPHFEINSELCIIRNLYIVVAVPKCRKPVLLSFQ